MRKQIGVFVNSFKPTEESKLLIDCLNELSEEDLDVAAFQLEWVSYPKPMCFGLFNAHDSFNFYGTCIATNLETAKYMLANPRHQQYFLYMNKLEWIDSGNYDNFYGVYCNNRLKLIVKNEEDFALTQNAWKTPSHIMSNWNVKNLLELI